MDDTTAGELEAAIVDAGLLLVRLDKYRAGAGPEATALRRRTLTLGDRARRLHHQAGLDAAAARTLLDETRALVGELQALAAAVRATPPYRAAVAAHAAGDAATLARVLPQVFDGLETVAVQGNLFHAVAWRRRGRPRRPADLAADVARLRADGLEAAGDDLAPGVDPALPAVPLDVEPPDDEPLVLRIPAAVLRGPMLRLADGGPVLIYAPRLRVPFTVRLRAALDVDALEEAGGLDYAPYRAAVAAALAAVGVDVDPE